MRVEKVNDNTLRVSMTREDLNKRGLKILDLLGNRERVQEFFLSISMRLTRSILLPAMLP